MASEDRLVEDKKGGDGFELPEYNADIGKKLMVICFSNSDHTEGVHLHSHYGDLLIKNNVYLL